METDEAMKVERLDEGMFVFVFFEGWGFVFVLNRLCARRGVCLNCLSVSVCQKPGGVK